MTPSRRHPSRPHARVAGRDRDRQHRVAEVGGGDVSPPGRSSSEPSRRPRPGHADLAGMQKYGFDDARDVLERASARETAARVAAGCVAKELLSHLGISVVSHVVALGDVPSGVHRAPGPSDLDPVDASPVRCFDPVAEARMVAAIKAAAKDGDSLGRSGRGSRLRGARRSREPRALGPQARRPARTGAHEHPGREGRRDRRGRRDVLAPRIRSARRDRVGRRARAVPRGPPHAPAGSKAEYPTVASSSPGCR